MIKENTNEKIKNWIIVLLGIILSILIITFIYTKYIDDLREFLA